MVFSSRSLRRVMTTAAPPLDAIAAAMLGFLTPFLPAAGGGLPAPTVMMISLRERSAGIGGRIGTDMVAGLGIISLNGIRLEGTARFQLWAAGPADLDAAVSTLTAAILAADVDLRKNGFVRISLKSTPASEQIADVGWRRNVDYRVLFEFPYRDTEDAESLLARIPIHIDSEYNESMLITDAMARWDQLLADPLVHRGRSSVATISALSFLPLPAPSGSVTLLRTSDTAQGAPSTHATLPAFLAATAGASPAETHASVTFASVDGFLAALGPIGDPLTLGDWNEDAITDAYQSRTLAIDPPMQLAGVADRFEIRYETPPFDTVGVLYLRLARSVTT
jgi:hypothetical protein